MSPCRTPRPAAPSPMARAFRHGSLTTMSGRRSWRFATRPSIGSPDPSGLAYVNGTLFLCDSEVNEAPFGSSINLFALHTRFAPRSWRPDHHSFPLGHPHGCASGGGGASRKAWSGFGQTARPRGQYRLFASVYVVGASQRPGAAPKGTRLAEAWLSGTRPRLTNAWRKRRTRKTARPEAGGRSSRGRVKRGAKGRLAISMQPSSLRGRFTFWLPGEASRSN